MRHGGRVALVSLLTAFAAGATSAVAAQDAPVDSAGPVDGADSLGSTARFEAVYDSVLSLTIDIEALDRWIEASSGNNRQLLLQRQDVRIQARRTLLARLAESVDPAAGDSLSVARGARADSLLASDVEEQRAAIVTMIDDASARRTELDGLEGAERARLGAEVRRIDRRLDQALTGYLTALTHRAGLGSDVTAELQELDDFLRLRAELLAARMASTEEDIGVLRQRLTNGETGLETEVAALDIRTSETAESLTEMLALMEERGLETDDYRRYLLVTTGDLTAENLSWGVLGGLVSDWVGQAVAWVSTNGATVMFRLFLFFAILAAFRVAAALLNRVLTRMVQSEHMNVSSLAREMLVRWATRGVMFLGVVIALSQVGLDLGPVLAGVGVAGFIVGFALQDTLSNFAAGVMILVYRPFDDGDSVEVAGVAGKVDNMSLVSTTILSSDNQLIVVPNSKIWGDVIRNVTAMGTRRIDLVFGISYEDDIETAERLLGEIVTAHDKVLEEPAPRVKVSKLSESSVDFIVRPWCRTEDYWDVYWDITRTVKMRFDEEGISFPFPHDVHVLELRQGEGGGSGVAAGRKKVLAAEVSDH